MLIVQNGWVTHNGISYGRGQALPKMKRPEELRLLDLGTCYEGDIPILAPTVEKETPPPIEDKEEETMGKEEEISGSGADINLNFDPDENIKPKNSMAK